MIRSIPAKWLPVRVKKTRQKQIRLPASAADLKFLHRLLQVRNGNFKSKSGTGIKYLPVPPMFPKFV
jgi:hypothetical protein